MPGLTDFGRLKAAEITSGYRVPVVTRLSVGDLRLLPPADPGLVLTPANMEVLQQMWDALRMPSRNNLLVTGESGSGKTLFIRYLGKVYQEAQRQRAVLEPDPAVAGHIRRRADDFQARILTFHENIRRSDITERRHYGESGEDRTGWTMSDVMDGMVSGDWNVLSEINRTGEDVQAEFNEPLENKSKSLHKKIIYGHPDCRFIATVNPVKGEGRGIYEGRVMSGEFVNRFTNKVHLQYLPADEEFEVLKRYAPKLDDDLIDRIIAVANDIRRDYFEQHGVVPFPVTHRALIRVVRHLGLFPADTGRLRSVFWRKAYWLDDRIHPPVAKKLVEDLLDLHDIVDRADMESCLSHVSYQNDGKTTYLQIGDVSLPVGPGGPYVPDTVIEEVPQNLADLEWMMKDLMLKENILLIGEAGVGKNKLESYLSHLLRRNLLVIGMSGETRVSDLITYRSFGEEEEGKTGDTSTLGLMALTDQDHPWMIVLDEANKANPGVLVSFNDILQDRLVRLPSGAEAPVHASICVNINPNRPPYEVNDFSFEFMDRFSIHTIIHLPADQAAEVLKKKYPDSDPDFVCDVVQGYYSLHPLYSEGLLFEPITMRNEEAAIERGMQQPETACNLIDLLCTGYSPKDAREQTAIRSTLESRGFDRNVLPSKEALLKFRTSWDSDKKKEETALQLIRTYQALDKPGAALDVLSQMLSSDPKRDWMYRLRSALIYLDCGDEEKSAKELKAAFAPGMRVHVAGREEYLVLDARAGIREHSPWISVEAWNLVQGCPALILNSAHSLRPRIIHRLFGTYRLVSQEKSLGVYVYERRTEPADIGSDEGTAGGPIREKVRNLILWSSTGAGAFARALLACPGARVVAGADIGQFLLELHTSAWHMSVSGTPGSDWSLTVSGKDAREKDQRPVVIGWDVRRGIFFCSGPSGGGIRRELRRDPLVRIAFDREKEVLYLVLDDEVSDIVQEVPTTGDLMPQGFPVRALTPAEYQREVVLPLRSEVYKLLKPLFVYARPVFGVHSRAAGDVVYTVLPDLEYSLSIRADRNGMGEEILPLPREGGVSEQPLKASPVMVHRSDSPPQGQVLPLSRLDACATARIESDQDARQSFIQDIRSYLASAFFTREIGRDPNFEAKGKAFLLDTRDCAESVTPWSGSLCRGDILVRTRHPDDEQDRTRMVFIVRFIQDIPAQKNPNPDIRGFWLGLQNPVGTLPYREMEKSFARVHVRGDDKHQRIIRHLSGICAYPFQSGQISQSGNLSDPKVSYLSGWFSLVFHLSERRLKIAIDPGDPFERFTLEEVGFPVNRTVVSWNGRDPLELKEVAVHDIRYDPEYRVFEVVLTDHLMALIREGSQNKIYQMPDGSMISLVSGSDTGMQVRASSSGPGR